MNKTIVAAVAALALTAAANLAIAAPPAGNTASPNRAAELLTQSLAEKVLNASCDPSNENLLADTKSGATWVSKAYYQVKSTQPLAPQVGLFIRHLSSPAEAENAFATQKVSQQGVDVSIAGASKAYRTKTPAQLNLLKGSNMVMITAGTVKAPDSYGQEKVAKEVLPKLTD